MSLESALDQFPKELELPRGLKVRLRPLQAGDAAALNEFFLSLHGQELMYIKHRVTDPAVTRAWCAQIDLGRNLPLLALADGPIAGVATLHQQLGGWKRHIGRISVHVHPQYRGQGLARALVTDLLEAARQAGLQKIEAEFIGRQESAMKLFGRLGFQPLLRLPDYVKDMQAVTHDYILMGLNLMTDEEDAGMG
jgi:GNAT superfamily N-acetyltransferase